MMVHLAIIPITVMVLVSSMKEMEATTVFAIFPIIVMGKVAAIIITVTILIVFVVITFVGT